MAISLLLSSSFPRSCVLRRGLIPVLLPKVLNHRLCRRRSLHLLTELFGAFNGSLLSARETLADRQHAVNNDGVNTLLDLAL